jgi:hypothetical protein
MWLVYKWGLNYSNLDTVLYNGDQGGSTPGTGGM